jgi:micrococcal nuclease
MPSAVRSAAILVAVIAVGCGSGEAATPERPEPPPTRALRAPTSSAPLASTLPSTTTTPASTTTTRAPTGPTLSVTRVVDGDTVHVSDGRTLRLIGMDTPETVDPRKPVQCFAREASARAHQLLDGATVTLEYDASQGRTDKYGRTLAYVWTADGLLYNFRMIADGYAHEYTYRIPYRYQDLFRAAERDARDHDRGLWSPATCNGDTDDAAPTPATTPGRPGCDGSYPTVCIPPSPPDLDCPDVSARGFPVVGADPHRFDADRDGVGCES